MKNQYINKFFAGGLMATALMTATSCSDFLDETPATSITEEKIFSDPEYLESNITSIYNTWRQMFTDRFAWELWIGTDEIQSGAFQSLKEANATQGALDRYDASLTSDLYFIEDQWNSRWLAVGESAKIVSAIKGMLDSDEEAIPKIYGEASFIRGALYLDMAMIWGSLPIIDNDNFVGYGRQPLADVWEFLINDLTEAAKYLPEDNAPGRATKYAANMLLGYAYMAVPEELGMRDFNKAKDALAIVVNSGKFSLPYYYDLFDYDYCSNTSESIFEWQFSTTQPDNNKIQFQIGSRAVDNWFGNSCYFSGYDHAVPTKWAYSSVDEGGIWEKGDIRKEESIRYDFSYRGKTPDLSGIQWEDLGDDYDELLPHIKKYEDYRTDYYSGFGVNNMWMSGKNIPWLRYANAILLYAECLNETGSTSEAVDWVNKVRDRGFDNRQPSNLRWSNGMSKDQFRDEILTERVRELLGERWRKFDLIRTGKFIELTRSRNEWTKRAGAIQEFNKYWPIPLAEIDKNDEINMSDQNEGYR